mmetsp:Transcript_66396/g.184998  ORF Transcript_66396/g.184998 Transcript_66396/m.184998 type:complete len:202 (-) Transcript_66396:511-1116(-)
MKDFEGHKHADARYCRPSAQSHIGPALDFRNLDLLAFDADLPTCQGLRLLLDQEPELAQRDWHQMLHGRVEVHEVLPIAKEGCLELPRIRTAMLFLDGCRLGVIAEEPACDRHRLRRRSALQIVDDVLVWGCVDAAALGRTRLTVHPLRPCVSVDHALHHPGVALAREHLGVCHCTLYRTVFEQAFDPNHELFLGCLQGSA